MGQKANVIKSLEMMGYIVTEVGGMYLIYIMFKSGGSISYAATEEQLEYGNFIVETIVGHMNKYFIDNF